MPSCNMRLAFKGANNWSIELIHGWQSRNISTAHLFVEALRETQYCIPKPFDVDIYTSHDQPPPISSPAFASITTVDNANVRPIPDFVFWGWPEVGILDYSETVSQMLDESTSSPVFERLFWAGNTSMHPVRSKLLDLAKEDKRLDIRGISWNGGNTPEANARSDAMQATNFVSLPNHCKFKYLIDVEGGGYSARLKILLFSGRPLFVQERPWKEFFSDKLEPFVHFIPVKRDLSDLRSQLDWAEAHPKESMKIAENAQRFAQTYLTRKAAIAYLSTAILDYAA